MSQYEYLEQVLANYFAADSGYETEHDVVSALRQHMSNSPVFSNGVRNDIQAAFANVEFSWKTILVESNVVQSENESEASTYARTLLETLLGPDSRRAT